MSNRRVRFRTHGGVTGTVREDLPMSIICGTQKRFPAIKVPLLLGQGMGC